MNKKLALAFLSIPLAIMCMEENNSEEAERIEGRISTFWKKCAPKNKQFIDELCSALDNHESLLVITPLLRKVKLRSTNFPKFVNHWVRSAVINAENAQLPKSKCKKAQQHIDYAILLSRSSPHWGLGLHGWPPHMSAVKHNIAPIIVGILDHLKNHYSIEKRAQTKQQIFTLFCCLRQSHLQLPVDMKRLVTNTCVETLLPPKPYAAKRLEDALSWETRSDKRAYDYAKSHLKRKEVLDYDIEELNPETAQTCWYQTHHDNCAELKKSIFKKEEVLCKK